ncbi:MAG: hypothetical protein Q8S73_40405 [Deltaproteobacteria bacterium]|nr:hypothetical protein [Deltaproteobacteria bacterium]
MNPLFRAMLPAEDGAPQIGDGRNLLGVRPSDVKGASAGPGQGGLSVTVGDYRRMMAPLRPKAFGGLHSETVMYELPQATLTVASNLHLGPVHDRTSHAVIEAREPCPVPAFQLAIQATRPHWARTAPPTEGP